VRISELIQKQSHWTIEMICVARREKLETVGGFYESHNFRFATELKASAAPNQLGPQATLTTPLSFPVVLVCFCSRKMPTRF